MEEGKTYFLRVRHNGTKYGSSDWSSVYRVSTLVPIQLVTSQVTVTAGHGSWSNPSFNSVINNNGLLSHYSSQDVWRAKNSWIFTNNAGIQLYAKFTNSSGPGPSNDSIHALPVGINLHRSGGWGSVSYSSTVELLYAGGKSTGIVFGLYLSLYRGWQ